MKRFFVPIVFNSLWLHLLCVSFLMLLKFLLIPDEASITLMFFSSVAAIIIHALTFVLAIIPNQNLIKPLWELVVTFVFICIATIVLPAMFLNLYKGVPSFLSCTFIAAAGIVYAVSKYFVFKIKIEWLVVLVWIIVLLAVCVWFYLLPELNVFPLANAYYGTFYLLFFQSFFHFFNAAIIAVFIKGNRKNVVVKNVE